VSEERARHFLAQIEGEIKPMTVALHLAHWEASTTGTQEALEKTTEAETQLRRYLSSKSRYAQIVELRDDPELRDPQLRRQLELLALEHRPNLLSEDAIADLVRRSNDIQSEFFNFRSHLNGERVTNNEILHILRTEKDVTQRKAAWEASKQIAPLIADRLRDLVIRRNDAARSLGFRDYYAMQLQLHEIDERQLFRVFDELKRQTDGPFKLAKADVDARLAARFDTEPGALRPWHYEDPFFQETPLAEELGLDAYFRGRDLVEIADRYYEDIGLPLRDVLDRSDLFERPGKDQHAYCSDIDREGDVRILCNVRDDDRWMGIILHELGHAAYDKFIPRELPWILREPAHIASTEAIAMFMDRLIYDIDWLEKAAGAEPADRAQLQQRASAALRFEQLLTARWVLVMTYFERELYADPQRNDLETLWWSLVEDLQYVPRPEDRVAPDWASKIHLTVAPVYYHNYLLGELIASQLAATFNSEILDGAPPGGYTGRPELGQFLRDRWFAHGASLHWQDLLEQATGSRLLPASFLVEFVT
jgi:peptidyl-dipeptidase A